MNKIKRFIDIYISTEVCNFKCSYCYISQRNEKASGKVKRLMHTPTEIREALSVKRLGGICLLNFCAGGETLLGIDILPIVKELIEEGHYVSIVTNGTMTKRFQEITEWQREIREKIFFKFSFHYLELKKRNLFDVFFGNINMVKEAGCSVSVELMPHDELVPYIDEIKEVSIKNLRALPHVTVGRDEGTKELRLLTDYDREDYKRIWSTFNSEMFDFKLRMFGEKRTEFCYAGEWGCVVNLNTGEIRQCYGAKVIGNLWDENEEIKFEPIGENCPQMHCFNCHVFMTLGLIPDKVTPTYASTRDRNCTDGTYWLSDKFKEIFSQRLYDNNVVYKRKCLKHRILLIGDSISEGYGKYVSEELGGVIEVLQTGEVARDTSYTLRTLTIWQTQMCIGTDIDLIYWNNGLWDVLRILQDKPQISVDCYAENLRRIIVRLKKLFPCAKIIFGTTTPVIEQKITDIMFVIRNRDIEAYNKIAIAIMNEQKIDIDDLYELAKSLGQDAYFDFTHLTAHGYQQLGKHIADKIKEALFVDGNKCIKTDYEVKIEELSIELEKYKDWVANLQEQNKEIEVYKDWVANLQEQNKEIEVYKGWVANLQEQINDLKLEH